MTTIGDEEVRMMIIRMIRLILNPVVGFDDDDAGQDSDDHDGCEVVRGHCSIPASTDEPTFDMFRGSPNLGRFSHSLTHTHTHTHLPCS